MALEAVLPFFADLIKEPFMNYVVRPLVRNISYPFRCDSKVDTLRDQAEKLSNKRFRLQDSVDAATRNGEKIYPDVTKWLTTAGKDIEDAEELIKGKAEAMNKCFVGLCPNLKTRYQLSKKAHKKALAVGKQLQDAQALPDPISSRPPPQPIVEPSVYSSEALPSRVLILNQIMDALKDPKLNMVGVYGMGGIGKTTLAKEVKGQAMLEKNLFETVVMVAVSQTPDLSRIQREIADWLGLKFDAEEVPVRASRLHKRLEKAKVLIILDDVWQKLDLTAVGVPSGEGYEGCKIFLTSRRREVLCNEMQTQKDFSLDVLKEDETLILFQKSVSNVTDPELRRMVTEIASKCAGLPLLILKVAADLRGKESYAWKDMSKRLSTLENTDIESSYENLLDVEAKSIFLLCALFGDSNIETHKLVMYSVGLELFKDTDSIEEARNRVLALIDKLKDDCLLLDGDNHGFVKIHDVVRDVAVVIASRVQNAFVGAGKVRSTDFQNTDCTRISLTYCNIPELPGVLECPKAEVFSLFAEGGRSFHPYRNIPDIPSSFFEGVLKLKVVDIYRVHFISGLPSSLGCLTGLRTLCLQRCEFDNVAVVAELKQLEVLSFAGSEFEELPGGIKGLTRLKILDLEGCYKLKVIPANVLSNLCSLEELYMLNSFSRWEAEGNARLEELKNLSHHLTTLEIQVEDDKLLPKDWFFNGVLQNYIISIGDWDWFEKSRRTSRRILNLQNLKLSSAGLMPKIKEFVRGTEGLQLRNVKGVENLLDDWGSFEKLQILEIFSCGTLKSLFSHSTGMVSFHKLTRLKIFVCNGLKYVFTNSMVKSFEQLEELRIERCESLEEIILSEETEEESINRMVFPKLESLILEGLPELKRFSSGHPIDFPLLRVLEIRICGAIEKNLVSKYMNRSNNNERVDEYFFNEMIHFPNLEHLYIQGIDSQYVFHKSVARCLLQLRKLEIIKCGVEMINSNAEEEIIKIEWPNLTHLEVVDCHKLIKFGSNNSKLFPKVEVLELDDHSFKAIQRDGLPVDFSLKLKRVTLKSLRVNGGISDRLFGFLRRINSLERLHFSRCFLESDGIFSMDDGQKYHLNLEVFEVEYVFHLKHILKKDSQLNPVLQHLQSLVVNSCDDLMNIAPSSASFQNLTTLEVKYCKKMTSLVTASTAKTMVHLMELRVSSCKMMEEIIASDDMAEHDGITFKNLKLLSLFCLDRLNCFCSGSYEFNFPLLELVIVNNCPRMKMFCSGILSCPKLQRIEIDINREKHWEGDLNATIGSILREWVGEPLLPNEMQIFKGLWKLIVRDCNWVEVVFDLEGLSIEGGHVGLLPELSELELINLPKLTQLCNRDPRGILDFNNLRVLKIENCSRLEYALTTSMSLCFSQLRSIEVKNCETMKTIIMEEDAADYSESADLGYCPSLKRLTILNCPSIKAFISRRTMNDLDIHLSSEAFPNLEELFLDIKAITAILQFELPPNFVSKVKKLDVSSSATELHVRLLHRLSMAFNLNQLKVGHSSFKELFKFQGQKFTKEAMMTLPQIRELELNDLDDLKQIWWQNFEFHVPLFQSLEVLYVKSCGQITSIASSAASFQNVRELEVYWCNQLRYIMTSSVAKSMVQLKNLGVQSCKMLTEIVGDRDDGITCNDVIFPKLETLILFELQSLKCFSSGNYAFQFPCLETVKVYECPNLRIFCHGIVLAPMLKNVNNHYYSDSDSEYEYDPDWDEWKGDLNPTIEHMHKNLRLGFPRVDDVKLSMFPILKEKWAAQFPFKNLHGLKRLEVDYCAEFRSAISSHILPQLPNLEVLIVYKCDLVEQVFDFEEIVNQPFTRHTVFEMEQLIELKLIDLPSLRNVWSMDSHKIMSFASLQVLNVQNCSKLTCIFDLSTALSFPNLQHLEVINCSSVEYIIAKAEDETKHKYIMIFPSLQTMKLKNLIKFLSFYSTSGVVECPSLKFIEVIECPKMELSSSPFSKVQDLCSMTVEEREERIGTQYGDSMVPLLGNTIVIPLLEELEVEWNNLTNYLKDKNSLLSRPRFIDLTGFKDEYETVPSSVLQKFPNLEKLTLSDSSMEELNLDELSIVNEKHNDSVGLSMKLKLSNLPKLKYLVRDEFQLVPLFQILVGLEVCECSILQILVPSSVLFQNLATLEVSKCDGMENLINSSTARSLVQLRTLKMRGCERMQEIVAVAWDEVENEIRFSQLEHLELDDLPSLTSFYPGNSVLHFPSLEEVVVIECPRMMTFSEKVEIKPELKKVKTGRREYEWEWEGSLNNTIHSLFIHKED